MTLARCLVVVTSLVAATAQARAAGHITVNTADLQLGSLSLRDVSVSAQLGPQTTRTCISASLGTARIHGCGWIQDRNGQLFVRHGHFTVVVPRQRTTAMSLGSTTITTTLDGDLSHLDLVLTGSIMSSELALHTTLAAATFRDLTLPFSVHLHRTNGALQITETSPLVMRVGASTLAVADAALPITPVITLHPGWPHWRLDFAWSGVELGPALAAATRGRVSGSGLLSGELAFRGDSSHVRLVRGFALVERGGELRVADATLRARLVSSVHDRLGIQRRLAATLSDFVYSRLAMTFGAHQIQVSLGGRGKRVAQDVDLTLNLRESP